MGQIKVIVQYLVDDTPHTDEFVADRAIVRIYTRGRGNVRLVNGRNERGESVMDKTYRQCETITRLNLTE